MFFLANFFWYLASLLPFWVLYLISDFFYLILYYVIGYRRKVVWDNLEKSFPEKSKSEINAIVKKFYHHLCDVFVEAIKIRSISFEQIKKRYQITNPELLENNTKKNLMVFMTHYGNWEWGTSWSINTKRPMAAIYQKIQNKNLDTLLRKVRGRFGMQLILNATTLKTILKQKKENKAYLMLADLTPHIGKIALKLNFLNRTTPVHVGAEAIANLLKSPCYYMQTKKVKRGHYQITLFEIDWDKNAALQQYPITRAYFNYLEADLRAEPAYWLWSHRRWKYA